MSENDQLRPDCDEHCPGWREWDYCDLGQRGQCHDPIYHVWFRKEMGWD